MSDPAKYRTKEEVEDYKANRDPIESLKRRAIEAGIISEADLKPIEQEIKAIVKEADEFAKSSPEPDAAELWTDVLQGDVS